MGRKRSRVNYARLDASESPQNPSPRIGFLSLFTLTQAHGGAPQRHRDREERLVGHLLHEGANRSGSASLRVLLNLNDSHG